MDRGEMGQRGLGSRRVGLEISGLWGKERTVPNDWVDEGASPVIQASGETVD